MKGRARERARPPESIQGRLATLGLAGLFGGRLGGAGIGPGRLPLAAVDHFLELLSGAESRNAAGRNAQGSQGPRVTAGSGLAGTALEGAEANQGHLLTTGKGAGDGVKDGVDRAADRGLGLSGKVR